MNTEDQINELLRRIEAIEKRQAKLACSETADIARDDGGNGTSEDEQWEELADMLGFESVHYMLGWMEGANGKAGEPMPGLCDEHQILRAFKAMLHGLACEECNGIIFRSVDTKRFCWGTEEHDYTETEPSRPAAAIAMLRAYREASDA